MKVLNYLTLFLCLSTTVAATNGIPENFKTPFGVLTEGGHSFNNIFFTDEEDNLLFVDFSVVADRLEELNIWREGKLMLEDKIIDLPRNTIYELNLNIMREGTYIVELVTEHGIKIQKEIVIK